MMNPKYMKTLELPKILSMLSALTCCEDAKEKALAIMPLTDIDEVRHAVQRTNDAFQLTVRFGTPSFIKVSNPSARLKVAEAGGVLSPKELLNIESVLRQGKSLSQWADQFSQEENTVTEQLFSIYQNNPLMREISSAIISEEEIDDNASAELSAIRRKIRQTELKARERMEQMVRSNTYQKYLQDSIITMRDGRFVVPVKAEYKNEVQGLVHDTSASGSTYFIEPSSVVEANNEIRVLQSKEQAEIERILAELSAHCAEYSEEISLLFGDIIDLNILFCKSTLASKMNAQMPHIVDNGYINLRRARHPLIDPKTVVPIDIFLGDQFSCLVITGPNTGGKTVTLKTLGLLTLMTLCGFLIPVADHSTISVFDHILVDIGDEQSIEQSLSTFSAHMTNIISILNVANYRSLILVDELGSGTDPVEGAALAISILEQFKEKNCKIAATTHYAELKIYALQTAGVENACCEFDVESLRPTYRLLIGVPGRSNAFAISHRLGLPADVIDHAKSLVLSENKRFEDVIDTLEESRHEYESLMRQLEDKNREIEKTRLEVREHKERLSAEKAKEVEKAKLQAMKIVSDVRTQAENLMDELNDLRREKDKEEFSQKTIAARSQLKNKLDKIHDAANPITQRENISYSLPRNLKVGDEVLIFDIDKSGTVIQAPDKSGNVFVQAGIMKTKVKQSNLRLLDKRPKVKFAGSTIKPSKGTVDRSAQSECDLRGMNAEEALMDLDSFIDNAVLANLHQITIIHGKGTGVLRAAVQQHLKRHRNIRTYRLGVFGEGESGVTIAELK
ncbi:MAG: endonuclease MutS2 [Oscillospiraceae bacterium]